MAWVLKMDEVIESGLVHDFDASLSGIGQELGAGAYSMSDVLALPIFKQEDSSLPQENETKHPPFQYVMCAATSPAVKLYDETLTYLNQGWYTYVNAACGRVAGCWNRLSREVFTALSLTEFKKCLDNALRHMACLLGCPVQGLDGVGLDDPCQSYEIRMLDNRKAGDIPEINGKLVKVHCISTEFTPRKHGGEKGVPFRIQVDTFKQTENGEYTDHLHSASCQIKVFKPKGADRKQKTDREKMEKRTAHEKEKYQPSYDTTVLTEMRLEPIIEDAVEHEQKKSSKRTLPADYGDSLAKRGSCSPWPDTPTTFVNNSPTPAPTFTSAQHNTYSVPDSNSSSPNHQGDGTSQGSGDVSVCFLILIISADLLKLTREDLVQICGPADGIRLYNALKSRSVRPRLTIYVCQEPLRSLQLECQEAGSSDSNGAIYVYHAIYLEEMAASEVTRKLALAFNIPLHQINQVYRQGPTGIHILVSDQLKMEKASI
ncbi:hypothetical protein DUI87_18583 [Hirundo rustica rustica]|uniref:Grh/CP2 DB domain-containing protein n=1 Tax=Hirundo rustica rustica TaxID=333673 RepID=A0A3M0JWK5_HIRRU|nr:hypothetical protein DUI87_18583 [Hirundo rustica rustica]